MSEKPSVIKPSSTPPKLGDSDLGSSYGPTHLRNFGVPELVPSRISQPAISSHIANLEQRLNVQLCNWGTGFFADAAGPRGPV